MRKVVVYTLLSLDGVAEAPEEFVADWDEAMDANLARVIGAQDDVILGRRSFDFWATFWPSSPIEPFASFINAVPKHVATSTPLDREWTGARAIEGDLLAHVRVLKSGEGGGIGVHASLSVARALLSAGLVDELRLVVAPTVVGRGERLLDGVAPLRLETIDVETSPTGSLLLGYRVLGS